MMPTFYPLAVAVLLQAAPQTGVIEGTVVDAVSGAPLANASVTVRYERNPSGSGPLTSQNTAGNVATTGIDGRFKLEAVAGVPFHFAVKREGYTSIGEAFGREDPNAHTLQPGKEKTGVVVRLDPEAVLAGRVFDPELDKPAAGLTVRAMMKSRNAGSVFWAPVQQATTGEDGRYRIAALPAGEYRLFFSSNLTPKVIPSPQAPPAKVLDYPSLFYPGVPDGPSALAVNLLPGASVDSLDMKLSRRPLYTIRGEVRMDGPPAEISLWSITPFTDDGQAHRSIGTLPGPGAFEIQNQPPGPLKLAAVRLSQAPAERRLALFETVVDADLEDVQLQLMPGTRATFAISTFGLKDGARDPLWTDLKAACTVDLSPLARTSMTGEPSAKAGPEGRGAFESVFVEPLRLSVRGIPDGWVLRQLLYNGHAVEAYRVEMNPAAPAHHFQILLAPAPNSVQGEVREGSKPAGQALVLAVRKPFAKDNIYSRARRATADGDGRFALRTLQPGAWRFIAVAASESWQRAFEILLAGGGVKQEVTESGNVRLTLEAVR
ncbi:MAG: carboxypeptidase regulatory-like domain-containing protein [Candidatus Solibacter usitatus]|nr:carboxypeptidase regulatory-like domain-containing protein [Candidatus Solibacter usitatus]